MWLRRQKSAHVAVSSVAASLVGDQGEHMERQKWMVALLKGLAFTTEPFRPLVEGILKAYEQELAQAANETLQAMIVDGGATARLSTE